MNMLHHNVMPKFLLKAAVLFLAIISIPISQSKAVQTDSSLVYRNLRQQMFAADFLKQKEPSEGFQKQEEVVLFVDGLAQAWAEEVSAQASEYRRLNAYVPMWITRKYAREEDLLSEETDCLIWSRHALPAFLADIAFLDDEPDADIARLTEKAFLIRLSNLDWGFTTSVRCEITDNEWEKLKNAVLDYPGIIQRYLDAGAVREVGDNAAGQYRESYERVQGRARSFVPFVEIQDFIYGDNLDNAFAALSARVPEAGGWLDAYVYLGERLALKYSEAKNNDLAFATLDLLARNTSEETLPRVKLRALYEQIDPLIGPSRFEAHQVNVGASALVRSDSEADLPGSLVDAHTGALINLESLKEHLVILDFWSVGCGPCIEEIPELNALADNGAGAIVVSVNNDMLYGTTKEDIMKFVSESEIAYTVVLDTKESNLMERFGVGGWPTRFLIDKSGRILMEPREKRTKLSLREIKQFIAQK